jgi:flagellar hook-length control protein FliK
MQTQKPIINLVSPNAGNPAVARQKSPAAPDVSFTQVLSREIAERPKAPVREATAPASGTKPPAPEAKPANANNTNNANANKTNANNTNVNNTNAGAKANAGTSTDKAASPAKAEANAVKKPGDAADKPDPAQDETQATSQTDPTAAMLALVASLNPASPAAIAKTPVQADAALTRATASGSVGIDNDPISLTPDTAAKNAATGTQSDADIFANLISANAANATNTANATDATKASPLAAELDIKASMGKQIGAASVSDLKNIDPKAAAKPGGPLPPLENQAANPATLAANPAAVRAAPVEGMAQTQAATAGASIENLQADTAPAVTITAASQNAAVSTESGMTKLQQQIGPRVGNPGWDQALGQKVVYLATSGQQSATLTLNPPDLGPLQVVLQISNDQANASFTAAQPEVRQALEAALPRLREMMSEAGISLGNATVSANLANQQQSTPGEQSRQNQTSQFRDNGSTKESTVPLGVTRQIHSGNGLVDTFV